MFQILAVIKSIYFYFSDTRRDLHALDFAVHEPLLFNFLDTLGNNQVLLFPQIAEKPIVNLCLFPGKYSYRGADVVS